MKPLVNLGKRDNANDNHVFEQSGLIPINGIYVLLKSVRLDKSKWKIRH